jgi:hypothetical protein
MTVAIEVDPVAVLRYRASVTHLDRRLPAGKLAAAAWGGLQDSSPRAAIGALHARADGVRPEDWEHPSLAQVWFRGGADYVVPREDLGVFTLGTYPRDAERAAQLERLVDRVQRLTGGRMTRVAELPASFARGAPVVLRQTSATGRLLIRWDARDIWVIPAERPAMDVEDARRELCRRFVHWFAPATLNDLVRWTGVKPPEATLTWKGLEPELVPVRVEGEPSTRWVLRSDADRLAHAAPVDGVRLLPVSDPFTRLDRPWLVPDPHQRRRVLPRTGESPGFTPGAILVDGEVRGVWHRQGPRVTLEPFVSLPAGMRDALEGEAGTLPIAGGTTVRWQVHAQP